METVSVNNKSAEGKVYIQSTDPEALSMTFMVAPISLVEQQSFLL
jgi:hypothetical protein